MMTCHFKLPAKINREYLLRKNSEENYFEYYLHVPVTGKMFSSPFRKDKNPSCTFFRTESGKLIFKDFAGLSFDFIGCVMYLYSLSYSEALEQIAGDFGYGMKPSEMKTVLHNYKVKEHDRADIDIIQKNFSSSELSYWNKYGISLNILHLYDVYSVSHVYINKAYFRSSSSRHPIFGYKLDGWKIYMPGQRMKFIGNATSIQGEKQLGDSKYLVITKSMKDVMVLHSMGIEAIAPHSECISLTKEDIDKYGKEVIVLYDNDLAGVKGAHKYVGYKKIFIKRKYGKDISDFRKDNTEEDFINAIHDIKDIFMGKEKSKYFYIFK